MCIVQAKYISKNGSADWGNCNATSADTLNLECVTTFSGAEIGQTYYSGFRIMYPSGSRYWFYSPNIIASSVETFVSTNFKNLAPGTYTLDLVEIYTASNSRVCTG